MIYLGDCLWAEKIGRGFKIFVRESQGKKQDWSEPDAMIDAIFISRRKLEKLIGRQRKIEVLTEALEEIASYMRRNNEPEEDNYDDTEGAFYNGLEFAYREIAVKASKALRAAKKIR